MISFPMISFGCGKPISVGEVQALPEKITLGDLQDRFGEACQGHGPVSWYVGPDNKDIWFWWRIPEKREDAGNDILNMEIFVAFEVDQKGAKEDSTIIWPKGLLGKNVKAVITKEWERVKQLDYMNAR